MDYFTILNLNRNATKADVKKAFLKLAMIWHPDKAESEEDRKIHTKKYEELQMAYKTLSSDKTRALYASSLQATHEDLRETRDVGYQQSDQFSKVDSETGTKIFDQEAFAEAFNRGRSETEKNAFEQLESNTREKTVSVNEYKEFIRKRDENIANVSFMEQLVNPDVFNAAFEAMNALQSSGTRTLEEFNAHGLESREVGELNSVGIMDEMSLANTTNVYELIGGGSLPDNFDFSSLNITKVSDSPVNHDEIEARIRSVQDDRNRLAQLQKEEFKTEASEIEQLYAGLFAEKVEELEPKKD